MKKRFSKFFEIERLHMQTKTNIEKQTNFKNMIARRGNIHLRILISHQLFMLIKSMMAIETPDHLHLSVNLDHMPSFRFVITEKKFCFVFSCLFSKMFVQISQTNIGEIKHEKTFFASKLFVFGSFFMFFSICKQAFKMAEMKNEGKH